MSLGLLGLVPDVAAILPDEAVDLHGIHVVSLTGLIGDAIEIIVERLAGELVALLAHEELADLLERVPVDIVLLFRRAWQLLIILRLEILLLFLIAHDVGAE